MKCKYVTLKGILRSLGENASFVRKRGRGVKLPSDPSRRSRPSGFPFPSSSLPRHLTCETLMISRARMMAAGKQDDRAHVNQACGLLKARTSTNPIL